MKKQDLIKSETKQLTLLDFNVLAEEIKTLTQNILENRWKIAEKLFYIKNHWNEYKKQDNFIYKSFKQFIEDYYGWTRNEAYKYIEAHQFKLLLTEKCNLKITSDTIDITTAEQLNRFSKTDEQSAIKIIEENPDITVKEVEEKIKQVKHKKKSDEGKNIKIDDNEIDFRLGDFIDKLDDIPDGSIDLILTDPPYPVEFIEEWDKLGQFAKKKLKPNGFCIAYCGHKNLFESMKRLNDYLDFYWIFSLVHSGNTKLIAFNNIEAGWKPILIYQNGYKKLEDRVKDIIIGAGREKNNHKWQQALDELNVLLDGFSKPGDTVCDPFAGSGTTLIAIKQNNRVAFGAEKDEDEYNIAKKRINDEL